MDKLITVLGPTAVGKTALSFALAEAFQTELISGDAYQVYKYMNIGTAKPTPEELQRYPHHLINIKEPADRFTAVEFQQLAAQAVATINHAGKWPVLVGGTGLYVQSLLEGYCFGAPKVTLDIRERAAVRYAQSSKLELQAYLQAHTDFDLSHWEELLCNKHRMIRVLELIESGASNDYIKPGKVGLSYNNIVIGLWLPRDVLYERINRRVELMMETGWVEEVEQLLRMGISVDAQAMKGIGYRDIVTMLAGGLTKAAALEKIQKETRHFAKRQLTWYKRMPYIHWIHKDEYPSEDVMAKQVIQYILSIFSGGTANGNK